ncbi:MAG: phosphoribosyltransferase family protein [Burkholderiaceae bacterium]|jgi:ComF family protein|nr:ComF family protein [Burkholderiales bacterium]MCZ8106562.1 phosphoribosyltransferase family protein [Burkholderiales bacterium]MCZ8336887.1 phosphoribosyltransferase family protein [Burkholderiaceae bacterium]
MHAALGPPLRRARRRLGRWFDHLAPRGCATCGAWLAPGALPGFCVGCLAELPGARRPRCARCGQPTDRWAPACTACAGAGADAVDATLAAADYAPPLDRVVTALKFGRRLALARPLGELLAARWLGALPAVPLDGLVPVPLGARRLAQRGFNPSLEMARAMSAALPVPLPVLRGRLRRVRETSPQSGLGLAERRRNLLGCFACDARLDGLRIGLVDDVMTSGSTVAEAARVLRAAGAASVVAIVVARTA